MSPGTIIQNIIEIDRRLLESIKSQAVSRNSSKNSLGESSNQNASPSPKAQKEAFVLPKERINYNKIVTLKELKEKKSTEELKVSDDDNSMPQTP